MTQVTCATPKQDIFLSLAELAQAVGHVNRLELLEHLAQGPRSVEELSTRSGMAFANTSRHLQILRRAGILKTERQGKKVVYSLTGPVEVVLLIKALGQLGEVHVAAVGQSLGTYYRVHDDKPPLSRDELADLIAEDAVFVVDVRAEDEFELGHIPDAINIPMLDLHQNLDRLPRDRRIAVYCRGPYCVQAYEAAGFLRSQGFDARRLEDGFPEWRALGFPVEAVGPAGREGS
ncbi:metalloregulator ArsR/SmtB family transcription factor (plasmid) [Paracoccus versutus]|uniref:Rhodanese-related sulfurtransferase n=1 Tax=Paracoccus versutus TaxID=34007 RepID=A0A3D9XSC1_PARVE|nr:metalloregulator ArsR/SmtB family transcription factor [Paracoccus versutus]REF72601.1 rhodanese-related sulfurtransferase [Paracoccus versutus]WGR55453.1 metalloregulator ArsR/SmtB family transcription factor [Paracoccus versutus]